jgi:hypothetical protein
MQGLTQRLTTALELELLRLPETFCSSFDYTTTGKNLTHPIIVAALARIVARESNVEHVGVDVRLNRQGDDGVAPERTWRFQPDVVGFNIDLEPVLFVDYESPNSSDERIIEKDVRPYLTWRKATKTSAPYILITTLPEVPSPKWEVRYTSSIGYGAAAKGKSNLVQENPLRFWTSIWKAMLEAGDLQGITILNINCRSVAPVLLLPTASS